MNKIKIPDGGTVTIGETFDWENDSSKGVQISNCGAFLTKSSYTVLGKSGGVPGTTPATVRSDITAGDYKYTETTINGSTPTMKVQDSSKGSKGR